MSGASRRCSRVRAHGGRRGDTRRLPGWGETEEHADHDRRRGAEGDDPQIECQRHRPGQESWRNQRRRGVEDESANRDTEPAANQRQDHAFRQQLTNDPPPPGAERGAHRELACPRTGARHQQVGNVGAADEQHESNDAEKEHRRHLEIAADHRVVHRLQAHATALIGLRIFSGESGRNCRQIGLRGADASLGLHPPDHLQHVLPAGARRHVDERPHRPHARAAEDLEVLRHDADDRPQDAVHLDFLADDGGITIEARLPQGLAHHDDLAPLRFILGDERPAGDRRDAKHVEDPCRHPLARHRLGVAVAAGHHHPADVRGKAGDLLERAAAPVPVEHVRRRGEAPRVRVGGLPDRDQPIRVAIRQRPKQRRVDEREDRAVGTDAECQRRHRDCREHRRRTQLAKRKLHIVTQLFEPLAESHTAVSLSSEVDAGFLDDCDVAHTLERELARRLGIHSAADQFARPQLEVQRNLVGRSPARPARARAKPGATSS